MSSAASNPIWDRFFAGRAMLPGKVFDDPRSVKFRKQLGMHSLLQETKPSSIPPAGLVERRGTGMRHHVLWLKDEGDALRESTLYRSPTRAARRTLFAENSIKRYLNRVHAAIKRIR